MKTNFDYQGLMLTIETDTGEIEKCVPIYEAHEIVMAVKLFDKEDIVLVAGGGEGLIASVVNVLAKKVIVYEPQACMVEIMNSNTSLMEVYQRAVGGKCGYIRMNDEPVWARRRIELLPEYTVDSIPMYDLKWAVKEHGINSLCLDVEGAEYEIFATDIPLEIRKIMVEWHVPVGDGYELDLFSQGFKKTGEIVGRDKKYPVCNYVRRSEYV